MKTLITGALAAATLVGASLTTAAPAAADGWRGGYHSGGYGYRGGYGYGRGGGGYGVAVGAGLLGLAVGAAIADRPHYYAPAYGYGYGYGYPAAPYAYGGCRTAWRFDPYLGREVPVRRCW